MSSLYQNNFSGTNQWTFWEYVKDTVGTQQYEVSKRTFSSSISAVSCPHMLLQEVNHSLVTPQHLL